MLNWEFINDSFYVSAEILLTALVYYGKNPRKGLVNEITVMVPYFLDYFHLF